MEVVKELPKNGVREYVQDDGSILYRFTRTDKKNHNRIINDYYMRKTSDGSGYYLVKDANNVFDAEGNKYTNGGGFKEEYPDPTLPPDQQRRTTTTTQETPEEKAERKRQERISLRKEHLANRAEDRQLRYQEQIEDEDIKNK